MSYPKIVYPSGGATTVQFTEPARFFTGSRKATRHDNTASSGVQERIWERTDTFLLFTMEYVKAPLVSSGAFGSYALNSDILNWDSFMIYALQGGAFDFYPDPALAPSDIRVCVLEHTDYNPKWRSLGMFTFDMVFRQRVGWPTAPPSVNDLSSSLFRTGGLCPTALQGKIQLWSDDFSAYANGTTPGSPNWVQGPFIGSGGGASFTKSAGPVLTMAANADISAHSGVRFLKWIGDGSYTQQVFGVTTCGVYQECTIARRGSSCAVSGFAIGVDTPESGSSPSQNYLAWFFLNASGSDSGNGKLILINPGETIYAFTSRPNVGDVVRMQVVNHASYGWTLEALVNNVVVASTAASSIQLTNAAPKKLALVVQGSATGTDSGSNDVSNWHAGVIG